MKLLTFTRGDGSRKVTFDIFTEELVRLGWKIEDETSSDDRDSLIALAEENGIDIDRRWSTERIRKALSEE